MKRYLSQRVSARTGPKNPSLHSYGKSSPREGSMLACLCKNKLTYSKLCCKGLLIEQGIGQIISPYPEGRAFSNGFSNGFS
jgi:hypothetical protein